jgi:hypothetical protein
MGSAMRRTRSASPRKGSWQTERIKVAMALKTDRVWAGVVGVEVSSDEPESKSSSPRRASTRPS